MDEQRRVNLVLAELREKSDDATRKFIEEMSASFKLEPAKVLKVLENLPFVLARGCTLDEARALAEKVQAAGGVCRLQEAQSIAPAQQQEEGSAAESDPEPAGRTDPDAEVEFGADMDEAPPASLVGEAKVGTRVSEPSPAPEEEAAPTPATIPLATGGGVGGAGNTSADEGSVKCIECGEVQPPGPACRNCSFPLPEK